MRNAGLISLGFGVYIVSMGLAYAERSAKSPSGGEAVMYFNQGWDDNMRSTFYHDDQGTKLIPFEWFTAMPSGIDTAQKQCDDNVPRFNTPDNLLSNYRLLPDPNGPDHLPVGITKSSDRQTGKDILGFTCAACHTGQLTYKGSTFRIDGGSAMLDLQKFTGDLYGTLAATIGITKETEPHQTEQFACFAKRVLLKPDGQAQQQLFKQVLGVVKQFEELNLGVVGGEPWSEKIKNTYLKHQQIFPFPWGYGRIDALGRGGNTIMSKLDETNRRAADAPVNAPSLWGAWENDWVEWNGSIQHPMARNMAQVIAVTRRLQFEAPDFFKSDVDLARIDEFEQFIIKLTPPRWPKEFPPINADKAQKGKILYSQRCAHCHVPRTQEPNKFGQRYVMNMIPLQEIGTDPSQAFNLHARLVNTGQLNMGRRPAGEMMQYITTELMKRSTTPGVKAASGDEIHNYWRTPLAYVARRHAGVWATPPFLHNGSVPTLYQLLLPASQRDACFYLGNLEFDPKHVGYVTEKCKDGGGTEIANPMTFSTMLPGNANSGHEFRNVEGCANFATKGGRNGVLGCELSDEERWNIIEYLKTCDLERPFDASQPVLVRACPGEVRSSMMETAR